MAYKKRRGLGNAVEADLEILPLMNLFVVLIPMLLLSAVFLEMSVIRMNLPPEVAADDAKDDAGVKESLLLAVTIRDDAFVVEGRGIQTAVILREGESAGAELQELLTGIVAAHPENEEAMVIARAETRYDDIVTVMDAVRDAGMPQISLLGAGNQDGS